MLSLVGLLFLVPSPRLGAFLPIPAAAEPTAKEPKLGRDQVELKFLAYNIFVRPEPLSWPDATRCRSQRIGERLAQDAEVPDVAVLTETFNEPDVNRLSAVAAERYPYQHLSLPTGRGLLKVNGGLSILSRYPIETVTSERYDTCSGELSDCLAAKGAVHALIKVAQNIKVNVVATHLDAGSEPADREARSAQLAQLRRFIDEHADARWPTVLLGDLNVDGIRHELREAGDVLSEYGEMMATLGNSCALCTDASCRATCNASPVDAVRSLRKRWSFDPRETRELNTVNCAMTVFCDDESYNDEAQWELRKRLDYVFVFDPSELVDRAKNSKIVTRVIDAMHLPFADSACGTTYLSDHQAVMSTVELTREDQEMLAEDSSGLAGPQLDDGVLP